MRKQRQALQKLRDDIEKVIKTTGQSYFPSRPRLQDITLRLKVDDLNEQSIKFHQAIKNASSIQEGLKNINQQFKRSSKSLDNQLKLYDVFENKQQMLAQMGQQWFSTHSAQMLQAQQLAVQNQLRGQVQTSTFHHRIFALRKQHQAQIYGIQSQLLQKRFQRQKQRLDKIKQIKMAIEQFRQQPFRVGLQLFKKAASAVYDILHSGINQQLGFGISQLGQMTSNYVKMFKVSDRMLLNTIKYNIGLKQAMQIQSQLLNYFGTLQSITQKHIIDVGKIANKYNVSADAAASVYAQFSFIQQATGISAGSMTDMVGQLARSKGVAPAKVFQDLASNSQIIASFTKETGNNVLRAATISRQLGIQFSSMSNSLKGMLDIQHSIEKQLQAQVLLGKDINFDKARQAVLAGDLQQAQRHILSQLGSMDQYNELNIIRRQALAGAIGMSVTQLQRMIGNQQNLNKHSTLHSKAWDNTVQFITSFGKRLGDLNFDKLYYGLMLTKQLGLAFLKSIGYIGQKIGLNLTLGKTQSAINTARIASKTNQLALNHKLMASQIKLAGVRQKGSIGGGIMGNVKPSSMLKGAAAMIIVAGAVFIFAKALQQFADVQWKQVGLAIASMVALAGVVIGLGAIMSTGVVAVAILAGAGAMAIMAGAVWVLGKAFQSFQSPIKTFSDSIISLLHNADIGRFAQLAAGMSLLLPPLTALAMVSPAAAIGIAGLNVAMSPMMSKLNKIQISADARIQSSRQQNYQRLEKINEQTNQLLRQLIQHVSKKQVIKMDGRTVGQTIGLRSR